MAQRGFLRSVVKSEGEGLRSESIACMVDVAGAVPIMGGCQV